MNSPDRNSKPANNRTVLVLDGDVLVRMPVVQLQIFSGFRRTFHQFRSGWLCYLESRMRAVTCAMRRALLHWRPLTVERLAASVMEFAKSLAKQP